MKLVAFSIIFPFSQLTWGLLNINFKLNGDLLLKKQRLNVEHVFLSSLLSSLLYEPSLTSCGQVFSMISMMVFLSLSNSSFFLVNVKISWCCSCVIALVLGTQLIYLLVRYEADFLPPHPEASWFD